MLHKGTYNGRTSSRHFSTYALDWKSLRSKFEIVGSRYDKEQ
jgi:hypothetical protein